MERRLDLLETRDAQTHDARALTKENAAIPPVTRPVGDVEATPLREGTTSADLPAHFVDPICQRDRALERLTPRRITELRARLASGIYASDEIIEEVAFRLLDSGDLR